MKWYNKTRTKCLDLDKIAYWEFQSKKDAETIFKVQQQYLSKYATATLEVVAAGEMIHFSGKEAEEIYNILQSEKTVLRS